MKVKSICSKLLALMLMLSLCLGLSVTSLAEEAEEKDSDLFLILSPSELYESDEDQIVEVKVTTRAPVRTQILSYTVDLSNTNFTMEFIDENLPISNIIQHGDLELQRYNALGFAEFQTDLLGIFTFRVPAHTSAGTYDFTVYRIETGYYEDLDGDGIKDEVRVHDNTAVSTTLTILPAEDIPDVPLDPEPQPGDPDSPYTVTIARSGEGVVHAGDTVTMNVTVSGAAFDGAAVQVNYNSDVFSFDDENSRVISGDGYVKINVMSGTGYTDGTEIAALSFIAKEVNATTAGAFTLTDATAGTFDEAYLFNSKLAATRGASVTVTKQYTVTFLNKDGAIIGTETVDDGSTVTSVPAAPDVENYTFEAWSDGESTLTADQIKDQIVTGDVTYRAVYTAESYKVTLPEDVIGSESAVFGEDYTGTIKDYDGDAYTYTVTYQAGDDEAKIIEVGADGSFTIPGENITGPVTINMSKQVRNVTVSTVADYVSGWTLVTVKTSDGQKTASGYCYDGNEMFYVEQYGAYVWLVEGKLTEANIEDVTVGAGGGATITAGVDVNQTGVVDFSDALAAYGCYQVVYNVTEKMELYLRADVNGDGVVNAADVTAVMQSEGYKNVQD